MIPDLLLLYAAHSPLVMKTRTLIMGANQPESAIFAGNKDGLRRYCGYSNNQAKNTAGHYTQLAQAHQDQRQGRAVPLLQKAGSGR